MIDEHVINEEYGFEERVVGSERTVYDDVENILRHKSMDGPLFGNNYYTTNKRKHNGFIVVAQGLHPWRA